MTFLMGAYSPMRQNIRYRTSVPYNEKIHILGLKSLRVNSCSFRGLPFRLRFCHLLYD
jgi:hypothetical protein